MLLGLKSTILTFEQAEIMAYQVPISFRGKTSVLAWTLTAGCSSQVGLHWVQVERAHSQGSANLAAQNLT